MMPRKVRRGRYLVAIAAAALLSAAQVAEAGIRSDEFNAIPIDTALWTFVNPAGDATVSATGSALKINVPGGVSHDLVAKDNRAPRLLQAAPNEDVEVVVKFDSAVASKQQMQGVIFAQDINDLIRFEVQHDGTATRLFIGTMVAGNLKVVHSSSVTGGAPTYLRIKRLGATWTLSHSRDGAAWTSAPSFTHALPLSSVGPFAGNAGSKNSPAFTALVDYFRLVEPPPPPPPPPPPDTTAPTVSALGVAADVTSATVTWTTDEPATSRVDFGKTSALGSTEGSSAFVTAHRVTLSALECETLYHYRVRSSDVTGNVATGDVRTFTTNACPPRLVSDDFTAATLDPAVWRIVDPLGDATISSNGSELALAIPGGVAHDLWTGAFTAPRVLQQAPDADFHVEAKFNSPVGRRYEMQGLIAQQDADDLIRFDVYSDGTETRLLVASFVEGWGDVRADVPIPGGVPVFLRLRRDGLGWTASYSMNGTNWQTAATFGRPLALSDVGLFVGNSGPAPPAFTATVDHFRLVPEEPPPPPDTSPPAIAGDGATAGLRSATVTWTTDEPANSRVDYGVTTALGSSAAREELTTAHSVEVTGLACGTTYHYRVRSTDAGGNEATGAVRTFATAACSGRLVSDEFDAGALDTAVWRVVDPVGDAVLSVAGGRARISLPAGTAHDLWTGALTAPRILQSTPDEDFEVELKFDSLLEARYQLEGLVVQQDADDLLRFDLHHDGTTLNLFAAALVQGEAATRLATTLGASSAPMHLRVKRQGDTWTVTHSRDGQAWTTAGSFEQRLTVTEVGPFAGNTGSPAPAFDLAADYFRVLSVGTPPPDTTPPVITAAGVTTRATSATVTWTTDEPATSAVDYGTSTTYAASEGTPMLVTAHAVTLSGLSCATIYHFRVRSTDGAANASALADMTFTTGSCPGAVVSDEFDGGAPNWGLWRLVDPVGDATASVSGGQLRFGVPGGMRHDLWTGELSAPRLLQAARNADFEIEAKFDLPVSESFQMQGLVAQQDHDDLVRFDVYSNGTETRLFGATLAGGVATARLDVRIADGSPLFLRIRRVGDTWTLLHSRGGRVWTQAGVFTHAVAITEVGLFVGNNGVAGSTPPAFNAAVDYFHNAETAPPPPPDTTPPELTDIAVAPSTSTALVTWTTNEPANSSVAFGRTADYGRTAAGTAYGRSHSVVVSGLACETLYHFSARSSDEDGNEGAGPDGTFTTGPCPPPIKSDEFDGPGLDPAWHFHDPFGDSSLEPPFGGAVSISVPETSEHDVWTEANHAPRLRQATRDEDFEVELRFETPVTGRHQMQGLLVEQDDRNLVRFEMHSDGLNTYLYAATIVNARGQTRYSSVVEGGAPAYLRVKRAGATWSVRYSRDGTFWTTPATFSQPLTVTALGPFAGNTGRPTRPAFTSRVDYFRVLSLGTPPPDTTPPLIGAVSTTTTDEGAILTWATDEPAAATIRYGTTTAYGSQQASSEFLTSHRVELASLACATDYHFQIVARDEAGNEATRPDATFSTAACPPPDVTPPVISSVGAQPSVRSALVTWTTDERATSRVDFGETSAYGRSVVDATLATTHRLSLPDLACGTTYHFRVTSADKAGNVATGADAVFQTSACPPPGGPDVDVWYGDDQSFGLIGTPQNWANVMGHVSDPDGVQRVRYSLNGSPFSTLVIDPQNNVRIAEFGDFNIELDFLELVAGANQVEIVATDKVGYQTTRVVTVRYAGSNSWPLPYTADWSAAARVRDAGQVVDGLWAIEGGDLRTVRPGYDRVVAIGERSWQNYEVSFPFTLNSLSSTSQHAGFGVAVGWQGHAGPQRPRFEYPFGLLCFYYRNFKTDPYHLWLMGSDDAFVVEDGRLNFLDIGTRYVMKMRNENIGAGMARYSCKVWRAASPEPAAWNVVAERASRSGSTILVADYADVSVGSVAIRPISAPVEQPPAITDVAASSSSASAWIRWRTDKPASTTIHYGATTAYGATHSADGLTDAHALTLWGLTCETTYHYKLVSTDSGGRTASSADRVLTTAPCASESSTPFKRKVVDTNAVRPHAKALGDLNGDGRLDAIYGQLGGQGGLHWYDAVTGTKHSILTNGFYKEDMQTADVDGDGDTDVVVGTLDGLRWFVNPLAGGGDPTTQWVRHTINDVYTHDIELGDFDRNGRVDIATEFGIFVQTATGTWNLVGAGSIDRDAAYYGTAVGDLNGDGYPDIVVSGPQPPHPVVWYENPLGSGRSLSSAWQRRTIAAGPGIGPWKGGLAIADINRDGRADVISAPMWANHTGLEWYEAGVDASGNITWKTHLIDDSFTAVHTFKVDDMNRDGHLDLVLVEQEQSPLDRISVMYGNGGSSWSLDVLARTGGHNTKIGDVDADGDTDILVANHGFYGADTPLELWIAEPLAKRTETAAATADPTPDEEIGTLATVFGAAALGAEPTAASTDAEHATNCWP